MRSVKVLLAVSGFAFAMACGSDSTAPRVDDEDPIEVLPDYASSIAVAFDAAGIGGSMFPDSIALTLEQKAAILTMHQAFMILNRDKFVELQQIELEARTARDAGQPDEVVAAIIARAKPLRDQVAAAFDQLHDQIWATYTPEQRAWLTANRLRICGPEGPPRLTEAQLKDIRAIVAKFQTDIQPHIDRIKLLAIDAWAAKQNGRPDSVVVAILLRAREPLEALIARERKLNNDVLGVLTPEQRERLCIPLRGVVPGVMPIGVG
jgi:Spy/CpxP family protein refolding chaperone